MNKKKEIPRDEAISKAQTGTPNVPSSICSYEAASAEAEGLPWPETEVPAILANLEQNIVDTRKHMKRKLRKKA